MFVPSASASPVDSNASILAAEAQRGQLVVCIGAGVSRAAGLPSGADLGKELDRRFRDGLEGYVPPSNPSNLLAVADAASALTDGDEALRQKVVALAPFGEASPAYAHSAIAALLIEGALTVLTWNWDTCIERAAPEETIHVARTAADMQLLDVPQLVKVHGCVHMVKTLLVTSEHLLQPPAWADDAFGNHLGQSKMVFVGIGDVADYAQRRIQQLVEELDEDAIRVVSPDIRSGWADNQWSTTMPDLAESRRIEKTADEFFDDLSRAWVRPLREAVQASSAALSPEHRAGTSQALEALGKLTAVHAIRWLRRATMLPRSGTSVVRADETAEMVQGLGALAAREAGPIDLTMPSGCAIGGTQFEVLITRDRPLNSAVWNELIRRTIELASTGRVNGPEVQFVVGGSYSGSLEVAAQAMVDITGAGEYHDDIVDGPLGVRPKITTVRDLVGETA